MSIVLEDRGGVGRGGGSPRRRTLTPLSLLSLRRSISRLASISSDILFASRSRASRSVRCRSVSLTGGAMRRANGSACDREPFGGFLGPSTSSGGGAEGDGEGGSEWADMVERGEDESSGRGGREYRIADERTKEWRATRTPKFGLALCHERLFNLRVTLNTCDNHGNNNNNDNDNDNDNNDNNDE